MRETLFMKCTNTAHFDDGEEVIANVSMQASMSRNSVTR